MKIAIIGLGEVGRCYAKALHASGYELSLCDARPAPAAADLASGWELSVQTSIGTWLAGCDWVLSCVTGAHALGVVEQCLAHAFPGTTLCDLTTASPDAKRAAAKQAGDSSVRYVDVAIMGAISLSLEKTPLLASGVGAQEFAELLAKANGKVRVIEGGAAGDAIALKILRSVFTKGMEALSVELLMAAETQGVRQKLYEQLRDIDETPLRTFIDMLVRTHVIHARRRAHEVHDAAAELAKHGLPSVVLPGVERRFAQTIQGLERQAPAQADPTIDEALAWLLQQPAQA
ncbi:NAD(P)-binding domain-containing protein [Polaromonas sp. P1(28)-13]|nr:NAD(P)-binding domain-containing protein [Polaromonas sp. P1(28)-13]